MKELLWETKCILVLANVSAVFSHHHNSRHLNVIPDTVY